MPLSFSDLRHVAAIDAAAASRYADAAACLPCRYRRRLRCRHAIPCATAAADSERVAAMLFACHICHVIFADALLISWRYVIVFSFIPATYANILRLLQQPNTSPYSSMSPPLHADVNALFIVRHISAMPVLQS